MTKWEEDVWRKAVSRLKVMCPLPLPVHVTRTNVSKTHAGWCEKRSGRFYITVDKTARIDHAVLILVHEWAHALIWSLYKERDRDHNAHFGIAYAEAYQAAHPENE